MSASRSSRRAAVSLCAFTMMVTVVTAARAAETRVPEWVASIKPPNGAEASSVVVAPTGGIVYVGGQTQKQPYAFMMAAYDSTTGTATWSRIYPCAAIATRSCLGATLAIAPDGGTLFLAGEITVGRDSTAWFAVAVDASTGDQMWTTRTPGSTYQVGAFINAAVSPLGDRLFLAGSTSSQDRESEAVQSLDSTTGAELWRQSYGGMAYEKAPLGVSPDGARVYTAVGRAGRAEDLRIRAFDASSGALVWAASAGGSAIDDLATGLAVDPAGRRVYVTDYRMDESGCCEIVLAPMTLALRAGSGTPIWRQIEDRPFLGASNMVVDVVASPDRVFISDGAGIVARRPGDGQMVWHRGTITLSGYWLDYDHHLAVSNDGAHVFISETLGSESSGWADRVETVAVGTIAGRIDWTAIRRGVWSAGIVVAPDNNSVFIAGGLIGRGSDFRGMVLLAYLV